LLKLRENIRTTGLVVITSDRGLAGAYNANVMKLAVAHVRAAKQAGRDVRLHVVGKKGQAFFRFSNYDIASATLGISDTPVFDNAEALGSMLVEEFVQEKVDEVTICYTNFRSAGSQVAATTDVLPITRAEVAGGTGEIAALYEFEPEPGALLSLLLPRYINTVIFAALLESSASEHAARRRAMKAATENGEELVKVLTRVANRERQAEITSEIMEVIGGAEALRDEAV
jgi:F-type H+-transporting ATPase subunit gamma